jgi:hypothetical protein
MACVDPKQEWTIHTKNDNTGEESTLVFCVNIAGGIITGDVDEVKDGVPQYLSTVTGTDEPLAVSVAISFRTFNFTWGASRVILAGNAFLASTPRTFRGRFAAFAAAPLAAEARAGGGTTTRQSLVEGDTITAQSPSDGDTGTGTGQQT